MGVGRSEKVFGARSREDWSRKCDQSDLLSGSGPISQGDTSSERRGHSTERGWGRDGCGGGGRVGERGTGVATAALVDGGRPIATRDGVRMRAIVEWESSHYGLRQGIDDNDDDDDDGSN